MFFNEISQIPDIARSTSCAIFVVPPDTDLGLKHALTLTPDDKKVTNIISVEQVREFIALSSHRETSDRFFVITPADAMNEAAQNAFLKTLEEPKPFCHFVLITEQPSALLPTIRSRSQNFTLRTQNSSQTAPRADAKTITLAKQLIAATPKDLPALATNLAALKPKPREATTEIVATAIELLYKTYFKTNNPKFLAKVPKLIQLHQNLTENGHLKLHVVADLL